MFRSTIHQLGIYLIALVWLVNGVYCKLMNGVPRHEQIVARILGDAYSEPLTKLIGVLEVLMAVWVLSRLWPRWAALAQIVTVLTMNLMEFTLAPDLLLFGRLNLLFALFFAAFVYFVEFGFRSPLARLP